MGVDVEYDLFGRSAVAEPELGEAAQRRIVTVEQLPEGGDFPPPVRFSTTGERRIRYLTWRVVRLCKSTKNRDSPKSRCGKAGRRVGRRPAFPRLCSLDVLEEEFREF